MGVAGTFLVVASSCGYRALMIDARTLLLDLVGRELRTISRRQRNVILRLDADSVIGATDKAPHGEAVPIAWVQDGWISLNATARFASTCRRCVSGARSTEPC